MLEIESGSAAEEAGLKIGDVILQVDETIVRFSDDVARAVNKSNDLFVILRVDRVIGRRRGSTVTRQSVRDRRFEISVNFFCFCFFVDALRWDHAVDDFRYRLTSSINTLESWH